MSAIYERWENGELVEVHHSPDWERGWQACESFMEHVMRNVTRVEIIDSRGSSYSNWSVLSVKQVFQDDGKTLKLFIGDQQNEI